MALSADVLIAEAVSAQEAAQLTEDFKRIGLLADLREVSSRRSIGDLAWFILAAVPLKSFFDQLVQEFATDSYNRLKTSVVNILQRKRNSTASPRILLLQDTITGIQIMLEPDMPLESYRQLIDSDFSTIRGNVLHYDRHQDRWCSELDDAEQA